jgi:protease PrsW
MSVTMLILSIIPAASLGIYFYLLHKRKKKLRRILGQCYFLGWVSLVVTLIISIPADFIYSTENNDVTYLLYNSFIKIGFLEELSKFILIQFVIARFSDMKLPYDGIIYSVFLSLGYLTINNLIVGIGTDLGGMVIFIFTGNVVAISTAVFMGYFVGKSKQLNKKNYLSYGLLLPVLISGSFHALIESTTFSSSGAGYFLLGIIFIAGVIWSAIKVFNNSKPYWDVFLSFANEDRAFAISMKEAMEKETIKVWFDEKYLSLQNDNVKLGDPIEDEVYDGIMKSKFGIIILSKYYLKKRWTKKEMSYFLMKEKFSGTTILPILHEISPDEVYVYLPEIADRVAISSTQDKDSIVDTIAKMVKKNISIT